MLSTEERLAQLEQQLAQLQLETQRYDEEIEVLVDVVSTLSNNLMVTTDQIGQVIEQIKQREQVNDYQVLMVNDLHGCVQILNEQIRDLAVVVNYVPQTKSFNPTH